MARQELGLDIVWTELVYRTLLLLCDQLAATGLTDAPINGPSIPTKELLDPFVIYRKKLPWSEALVYCRDHVGFLATLPTLEQAKKVVEKLYEISEKVSPEYIQGNIKAEFGPERRYWIGLTDLAAGEGKWTWMGIGEPLSYDGMWYTGQPDHVDSEGRFLGRPEHCVALWNPVYHKGNRRHSFADVECNHRYYFICQKSDTVVPPQVAAGGNQSPVPGNGGVVSGNSTSGTPPGSAVAGNRVGKMKIQTALPGNYTRTQAAKNFTASLWLTGKQPNVSSGVPGDIPPKKPLDTSSGQLPDPSEPSTDLPPEAPPVILSDPPTDIAPDAGPDNPSGSQPDSPANTDLGSSTDTDPSNPADDDSNNPADTDPSNPADTDPGNPANTDPDNPANTDPDNPANTDPDNLANTDPGNPANTDPDDPTDTDTGNSTDPDPDSSANTASGDPPANTDPDNPPNAEPGNPPGTDSNTPSDTIPHNPPVDPDDMPPDDPVDLQNAPSSDPANDLPPQSLDTPVSQAPLSSNAQVANPQLGRSAIGLNKNPTPTTTSQKPKQRKKLTNDPIFTIVRLASVLASIPKIRNLVNLTDSAEREIEAAEHYLLKVYARHGKPSQIPHSFPSTEDQDKIGQSPKTAPTTKGRGVTAIKFHDPYPVIKPPQPSKEQNVPTAKKRGKSTTGTSPNSLPSESSKPHTTSTHSPKANQTESAVRPQKANQSVTKIGRKVEASHADEALKPSSLPYKKVRRKEAVEPSKLKKPNQQSLLSQDSPRDSSHSDYSNERAEDLATVLAEDLKELEHVSSRKGKGTRKAIEKIRHLLAELKRQLAET